MCTEEIGAENAGSQRKKVQRGYGGKEATGALENIVAQRTLVS
jgi:hypothetical protein